jgi:CHAT domain-containing protein
VTVDGRRAEAKQPIEEENSVAGGATESPSTLSFREYLKSHFRRSHGPFAYGVCLGLLLAPLLSLLKPVWGLAGMGLALILLAATCGFCALVYTLGRAVVFFGWKHRQVDGDAASWTAVLTCALAIALALVTPYAVLECFSNEHGFLASAIPELRSFQAALQRRDVGDADPVGRADESAKPSADELPSRVQSRSTSPNSAATSELAFAPAMARKKKPTGPADSNKPVSSQRGFTVLSSPRKVSQAEAKESKAPSKKVKEPSVADLDRLAEAAFGSCDYSQARRHCLRSLEMRESGPTPDAVELAVARRNLARADLLEIRDSLSEEPPAELCARAESMFRQCLQEFREALTEGHVQVGETLVDLADLQFLRGMHDEAADTYENALVILEPNLPAQDLRLGRALSNLWLLNNVARRSPSLPAEQMRKLLSYRRQRGLERRFFLGYHTDTRVGRSPVYLHQHGRYREAAFAYRRQVAAWIRDRFNPNRRNQLISQGRQLGAIYELLGEYGQAGVLYRRLRTTYAADYPDDNHFVYEFDRMLGALQLSLGHHAEAETHFEDARQYATKRDHFQPRMEVLNDIAELYVRQGRYVDAEHLARQNLAIWEEAHPNVNPMEQFRTGPSSLYHRSSQVIRLERDHERKLFLPRDAEKLRSLGFLALIYSATVQIEQAESLYEYIGEHMPVKAAEFYCRLGEFGRAERLLQGKGASSIFSKKARHGAGHPAVTHVQLQLGKLYQQTGKLEEARAVYQEVADAQRTTLGTDNPEYARTLHAMADLHVTEGEHQEAQQLCQQALAVLEDKLGPDHETLIPVLTTLSTASDCEGRLEQASSHLERVVQITGKNPAGRHPDLIAALRRLGGLYATLQRAEDAVAAWDRACRLQYDFIRRVLPLRTEQEQMRFLTSDGLPLLEEAIAFAVAHNDDDVAARSAEWILNAKGAAFQATSERIRLARSVNRPEVMTLLGKMNSASSALAYWTAYRPTDSLQGYRERRLANLQSELQELSRELAFALADKDYEVPWVSLDQIRDALPDHAALIEVAKFRPPGNEGGTAASAVTSRYAAWVIGGAADRPVQLVDLGEATGIESALQSARRAIVERAADVRNKLEAVSDLVLRPLEEQISEKSCWLVSPDAALWLLPWETLITHRGEYLIERHQVVYLTTGRDLLAERTESQSGRPLIIADPDYDAAGSPLSPNGAPASAGSNVESAASSVPLPGTGLAARQWRRLPGTNDEALAVTPLVARYAAAAPRVHTDREALEEEFKSVISPKIVLLSTHGYFEGATESISADHRGLKKLKEPSANKASFRPAPVEHPLLRCGLVLAGANRRDEATVASGNDGILMGMEIVHVDLRGTELVVLSACETGIGEISVGEGVAGLRQAFQQAGARTVVSTLWKIPDEETADLVSHFFRNLAAGQGHGEALRNAQLDILRSRRDEGGPSHPFYWAAFTLTGDWR